jgi:ribosomal protein S18 acetylase RimI-like enzyme
MTHPRPASPPIRTLSADDLAQAHALTQAVRWPHRVEDWRFALAMGEGFAVADGPRLLGTSMSWAFGPERGCFGMLIVAADQQGRGLGARLMGAALDALGLRAVQLHATPDGVSLYRRLGFADAGAIRQHQGVVGSIAPAPLPAGMRLRPGDATDLAALATLDEAATAMQRGRVLSALLGAAETVVLERDGAALGFAMLRPFGRGEVIGPVVAPDAATAWALIAHLLARRPGAFVRIDITDFTLSPLLGQAGLACVDEAPRMVRGAVPPPGAVRSFALVSQALG